MHPDKLLPSSFWNPPILPSLLYSLSIPGNIQPRYIPQPVVNARVSLEDLRKAAETGEIIWRL